VRKNGFIEAMISDESGVLLDFTGCTHSGGPTFSTDGTETLIGVHRSTSCDTSVNVDTRVDLVAQWLQDQIKEAKPEECVDNCTGTCSTYDCASNSCNPDASKCSGGDTCNPTTFQCEKPAQCQAGTWDTASCGECGRRQCKSDETGYKACESYSACGNNENCVQQSNTNFTCQAQQICTPGQKSSADCPGKCGVKTCNSAGTAWSACQANNGWCGTKEVCASDFSCDCTPTGTTRSCVVTYNPYTPGEQSCASSGNWTTCQAPQAQICTPNAKSTATCPGECGVKTCNSDGTAWSSCTANSNYCGTKEFCSSTGMYCRCTPGTSRSCTVSFNPYTPGTELCDSTGDWGPCTE
jgi:hypothetical protein